MQAVRPAAHVLARGLLPPLRASSAIAGAAAAARPRIASRLVARPQAERHLGTLAYWSLASTRTSPSRPAIPRAFPRHRRPNSTLPPKDEPPTSAAGKQPCPNCDAPATPAMPPAPRAPPGHVQDYIPFIRNLIHRSDTLQQKAHHRPTKEDLLAATSHWWQRFWIRVKWFTIRGWRRFNTDDLSAFFSWFLVGNTLWILLGTTTFISAVFATLNSLSMQEYVARWISDYLTSQAGVTVIFESAIVPRWGASTISFKNVYVSRRPQDTDAETTKTATAKPPAAIAFPSSSVPVDTYVDQPPAAPADNFTMFDINFDEIEVTLDLRRWLDGKGLVKDAKCKGVRGVIDRRCVWWDTTKKLEPADFRHATHPGDFELESFQVEDFLVTVYQPGGQRPYNVSIFNARFGPFRKRWLFYDMLSAEAMTGQYDNCLFSLHMPQKLGRTKVPDVNDAVKRMARFRIDGLPIEHAQYASGNEGPMSWILSGKLDAVLDIKFPSHPDDDAMDVKALIDQIGKNVTAIAMSGQYPDDATGDDEVHERAAAHIADTIAAAEASSPSSLLPGQHRLSQPALRAPEPSRTQEDRRQLTIDIDLRFRDLKAAVPVFTSDLSVTNNALIRPIVAFINANRTLMPIHAQVHADLTDFDGSWTLFETGLMSSISEQIYAALAYHVSSEAANSKRLKQVSFWGIQRGAEVLLDTLKVVVDPLQTQAAMAAA